jgi:hypothetical protein
MFSCHALSLEHIVILSIYLIIACMYFICNLTHFLKFYCHDLVPHHFSPRTYLNPLTISLSSVYTTCLHHQSFTLLAEWSFYNTNHISRCQWLTPVILATQETEIRWIMIRSQPWQRVSKTLSQKTLHQC